MNYTDKELIRASQITYLDIGKDALEEVSNAIDGPDKTNPKANYTLLELYKYLDTFKRSVYKDIADMAGLEVDYVMNNSESEEDINKICSAKG